MISLKQLLLQSLTTFSLVFQNHYMHQLSQQMHDWQCNFYQDHHISQFCLDGIIFMIFWKHFLLNFFPWAYQYWLSPIRNCPKEHQIVYIVILWHDSSLVYQSSVITYLQACSRHRRSHELLLHLSQTFILEPLMHLLVFMILLVFTQVYSDSVFEKQNHPFVVISHFKMPKAVVVVQ